MNKFGMRVIAAAALAVTGVSAYAQVDISANPVVPVTYAREAVGTNIVLQDNAAGTALGIRTTIRRNFSSGEVLSARVELSGGATFSGTPTITVRDAANNVVAGVAGAVNGLNTSIITFSLTSPVAPAAPILETWTVTITGTRTVPNTNATINAAYSLHDSPASAQNNVNRITGNASPVPYIQFANSIRLTADQRTETANVSATPAFTNFVDGNATKLVADLASITYGLPTTVPLSLANPAAPLTLPDLVANTTTLVVNGDFSLAANADGTFTGAALPRVYLTDGANCLAGAVTNAAALTATAATFNVGNAGFGGPRRLCFAPRLNAGGTATVVPIPASPYTANLNTVTANAGLYAVQPITNVGAGSIVRNGTELQMPLFQTTPGYISRFVLTNTSGVDANYTVVVRGESGAVLGTANLAGTIPANSMRVFNSTDILTSVTGGVGAGAPRAFAVFNIDRPTTAVQGAYQVVNPTTGSVSQTNLIRPGSN